MIVSPACADAKGGIHGDSVAYEVTISWSFLTSCPAGALLDTSVQAPLPIWRHLRYNMRVILSAPSGLLTAFLPEARDDRQRHNLSHGVDGRLHRAHDQPVVLPHSFEIVDLADHHATAVAIRDMRVRGAGAIGAAAGYGMAQVALEAPDGAGLRGLRGRGRRPSRATRPTAQDLFYAVNQVQAAIEAARDVPAARQAAVETAQALADENAAGRRGHRPPRRAAAQGRLPHADPLQRRLAGLRGLGLGAGADLCRQAAGRHLFVFADETRPRSQGARLTAWELANEGIAHAVIADNAAGFLMQRGEIDLCIVGTDRIAANGDVANKIGTYEKAVVRARAGHPLLRGRADLDDRPRLPDRRRHPHRGAQPGRGALRLWVARQRRVRARARRAGGSPARATRPST